MPAHRPGSGIVSVKKVPSKESNLSRSGTPRTPPLMTAQKLLFNPTADRTVTPIVEPKEVPFNNFVFPPK